MVLGVQPQGQAYVEEVALAGGRAGALAGLGEHRKQDRGQGRDDPDHKHKLD